jgi:hypothetical protein
VVVERHHDEGPSPLNAFHVVSRVDMPGLHSLYTSWRHDTMVLCDPGPGAARVLRLLVDLGSARHRGHEGSVC